MEGAGERLSIIDQWERQNKVTAAELHKIFCKAIKVGGMIMKKKTLSNLRTLFPKSFNTTKGYSDSISAGVRIAVFSDKAHQNASVHVLGTRKKSSSTFILRFFENGTFRSPDRDKDGHKRGSIQPLHFFADAIQATKGEVEATINSLLEGTINEINNRRS